MQKAIFLDRDGVINSDIGHYYIYKPEDFTINTGIIEALIELKRKGYIFIVISNQGGISKGTYSKQDVDRVHNKLINTLKQHNIELLEIYYCPHHSNIEKCLCRKPNSLMLEKAVARFNIDVTKSYMIGDNITDIKAAENIGIKGIKIKSNQNILSIPEVKRIII
jgi:D-glycero-D-manno-heptose 1,7-bisphosphate phosphatase